jgi:hypothetical protein
MLTISGLARIGTHPSSFGDLMRYIEKHPGKHVTPPKTDSNALERWCER